MFRQEPSAATLVLSRVVKSVEKVTWLDD